MTGDADKCLAQLDLLLKFARMSDLTVDFQKTYGWSTSGATRTQMRHAGLTVKHFSKDLDARLGYSRQFTNCFVRERFQLLDDFWGKLRCSKAPHAAKVAMLRTVAWPRGLRAVASAPFGSTVWVTLRRKAVGALGLRKSGINSAVVIVLLERDVDPQCFATMDAARSGREFQDASFLGVCSVQCCCGSFHRAS